MDYRLERNHVYDLEDDKDLGDLVDFLDDHIAELKAEILSYTTLFHKSSDKSTLRKKIEDHVEKSFRELFDKKNELSFEDIESLKKKQIKEIKNKSTELDTLITNFIYSVFDKKQKTGGEMFKTLKEARQFTAHLDALADEIQNDLNEVSTEMRQHLAYRLDRLSDLIEGSAAHKEAAMNREANGMGQGAWVYDKDEASYMSTMGGTGALKRDPDEGYMDQYKNDDHMEVLKRQEPANIMGAGAKKKQPSDNYNEAAVASKLRNYVKKAMEKVNK